MAATTTATRAVLRKLFRELETSGLTIKAALEAWQDSLVEGVTSGQQIVATSANGHSVTFAQPGGSMSPEDMLETSERLLTLLDIVVSTLALDDEDEGNNDAIYDGMMLRLASSRRSQSEFSRYRP